MNNHEIFSIFSSGVDDEVKQFQTYSSTWSLNLYHNHLLMSTKHLCESPWIKYLNSGQFPRFSQTSHHEWKNIHYQLKFHLDCLGYQLKNIHIPLQSECLYHILNIFFIKINIIKRESTIFIQEAITSSLVIVFIRDLPQS